MSRSLLTVIVYSAANVATPSAAADMLASAASWITVRVRCRMIVSFNSPGPAAGLQSWLEARSHYTKYCRTSHVFFQRSCALNLPRRSARPRTLGPAQRGAGAEVAEREDEARRARRHAVCDRPSELAVGSNGRVQHIEQCALA